MSENLGPGLGFGSRVEMMRPSPLNTNSVSSWSSGVNWSNGFLGWLTIGGPGLTVALHQAFLANRRLGLHPESEARPRANLQRVDLLEPNTLEASVVKETAPGTKEHRHDVDPELVDELRIQQLLGDAGPAHHLTALSRAAAFAWATAVWTPSVTKVKVRCSSCFGATRGG